MCIDRKAAKVADDILARGIPQPFDYDCTDLDVLHNQLLAERFEADFTRIFKGEEHEPVPSREHARGM